MAVAPLSAGDITREAVMDFTYPFHVEPSVGLYRKSYQTKVCFLGVHSFHPKNSSLALGRVRLIARKMLYVRRVSLSL